MTAVRSPTGLLYRGSRGLSRASGDAETLNSKINSHFTLSSVGRAKNSALTSVAVFLNSRRAGSFLPTGTTRTTGSGMKRGRSRERDARAVWVFWPLSAARQVTLVTTMMKLESLFSWLLTSTGDKVERMLFGRQDLSSRAPPPHAYPGAELRATASRWPHHGAEVGGKDSFYHHVRRKGVPCSFRGRIRGSARDSCTAARGLRP